MFREKSPIQLPFMLIINLLHSLSSLDNLKIILRDQIQNNLSNLYRLSCFYFVQNDCVLEGVMVKGIAELSLAEFWLFSNALHGHFDWLKLWHFSILKILLVWSVILYLPLESIQIKLLLRIRDVVTFDSLRAINSWNIFLLADLWFLNWLF